LQRKRALSPRPRCARAGTDCGRACGCALLCLTLLCLTLQGLIRNFRPVIEERIAKYKAAGMM